MKAFVFFVLIASSLVGAKIEWHFECSDIYCLKLSDLTLGTPEQQISEVYMVASDNTYCLGLWIPDLLVWHHGFNPNTSSSFKSFGNQYNSIIGRDNFHIKSSTNSDQFAEQKMFNLVNDDGGFCGNSEDSLLSIAHATKRDNNTFFDSIFATEKEPVAVFVYDIFYPGKRLDFYYNGTMTLGERPEYCQNWLIVDEVKPYSTGYLQWNFNLSKVSIGKFAASQPGAAVFEFENQVFKLTYDVYTQAVEILGVDENGLIDCDTTLEFVFTIENVEFKAGPDEYIKRNYPTNGVCSLKIMQPDHINTGFILPNTMLRDKCLLYNYETFQLGFADKVQ